MTANTANSGNTANTANTGNAGTVGLTGDMGAWFIPDRVDLPFVTELDSGGNPLKDRRRTGLSIYPNRSWGARWHAWLVLHEFIDAAGWKGPATSAVNLTWNAITPASTDVELELLVDAARDERSEALGEILSQDVEFFSDYMALLGMTPGSHPQTYRSLHIASLIGAFVVLHFKGDKKRPRPSQLCPALRPPIPVPGHSSFPSGHSTQAHLMFRFVQLVLQSSAMPATDRPVIEENLLRLARRVARNREIAGLHYRTDSDAGEALAGVIFTRLTTSASSLFTDAIGGAATEWA